MRVQLNLKIEDEEELKRLRESYNPDRLFELESLLREYENKIALLTLKKKRFSNLPFFFLEQNSSISNPNSSNNL